MATLESARASFFQQKGIQLEDLECGLCRLDLFTQLFLFLDEQFRQALIEKAKSLSDTKQIQSDLILLHLLPRLTVEDPVTREPAQTRRCPGCDEAYCGEHGDGIFCMICSGTEWSAKATRIHYPMDVSRRLRPRVEDIYESMANFRDRWYWPLCSMIENEMEHWLYHPGVKEEVSSDEWPRKVVQVAEKIVITRARHNMRADGLPGTRVEEARTKLREKLTARGVRYDLAEEVLAGRMEMDEALASAVSDEAMLDDLVTEDDLVDPLEEMPVAQSMEEGEILELEGELEDETVEKPEEDNIRTRIPDEDEDLVVLDSAVVVYEVGSNPETRAPDDGDRSVKEKLFECCPFCGEDFNFSRNPRFCPYCKEELN